MNVDVGIVDYGLNTFDTEIAGRAPAAIITAVIDDILTEFVLILYTQGTELMPTIHETCDYITLTVDGNIIRMELKAGTGLLLTALIVYFVGKLYTTLLSVDTLIVVICLEVKLSTKPEIC